MSRQTLILRYTLFAVVAVVVNLITQRMVLTYEWQSEGTGLAMAIAAGTLTGLVAKYILDKRWIFFDTASGAVTYGRQFALYTGMGVVTTCIFWGSETLFWLIWKTDTMREVGAVLGLTVGYVTKYRLDKRFVFNRAAPGVTS